MSAERSRPLDWPEKFASQVPTSLPFENEEVTVEVIEIVEGISLEDFLAHERRLDAAFRAEHGL